MKLTILTLLLALSTVSKANEKVLCYHEQVCNIVLSLIEKEHVEVLPIPHNADPHQYEIKAKEVKKIIKSKYFISPPNELTPWLEKVVAKRDQAQTFIMNTPLIKGHHLEDAAHFWLLPDSLCAAMDEIQLALKNWNYKTKNVSCNIQAINQKMAKLSAKTEKLPIIITHSAIAPLLDLIGRPYFALRGSHHGEKMTTKTIKRLNIFLEKNKKVIWLNETNIHNSKSVKKFKRKNDLLINIQSTYKVGSLPSQMLLDILSEL